MNINNPLNNGNNFYNGNNNPYNNKKTDEKKIEETSPNDSISIIEWLNLTKEEQENFHNQRKKEQEKQIEETPITRHVRNSSDKTSGEDSVFTSLYETLDLKMTPFYDRKFDKKSDIRDTPPVTPSISITNQNNLEIRERENFYSIINNSKIENILQQNKLSDWEKNPEILDILRCLCYKSNWKWKISDLLSLKSISELVFRCIKTSNGFDLINFVDFLNDLMKNGNLQFIGDPKIIYDIDKYIQFKIEPFTRSIKFMESARIFVSLTKKYMFTDESNRSLAYCGSLSMIEFHSIYYTSYYSVGEIKVFLEEYLKESESIKDKKQDLENNRGNIININNTLNNINNFYNDNNSPYHKYSDKEEKIEGIPLTDSIPIINQKKLTALIDYNQFFGKKNNPIHNFQTCFKIETPQKNTQIKKHAIEVCLNRIRAIYMEEKESKEKLQTTKEVREAQVSLMCTRNGQWKFYGPFLFTSLIRSLFIVLSKNFNEITLKECLSFIDEFDQLLKTYKIIFNTNHPSYADSNSELTKLIKTSHSLYPELKDSIDLLINKLSDLEGTYGYIQPTEFIPSYSKFLAETFVDKKFEEMRFIDNKKITVEETQEAIEKICFHVHEEKNEETSVWVITPCKLSFNPSLNAVVPHSQEEIEKSAFKDHQNYCNQPLSSELLNTALSILKQDKDAIFWLHKDSHTTSVNSEIFKNNSILSMQNMMVGRQIEKRTSPKKRVDLKSVEDFWENSNTESTEVVIKEFVKEKKILPPKPKVVVKDPSSEDLPYKPLVEVSLPLDENHPLIKNQTDEVKKQINELLGTLYNKTHPLLQGLFVEQKQVVLDLITAWIQNSSMLLSLPMGQGKTRVTSTLIKIVIEIQKILKIDSNTPTLILSPKALIEGWTKELKSGVISDEHLRINGLFKEFFTTRITPTIIFEVLSNTGYLKNGGDAGKDLENEELFIKELSVYLPAEISKTVRAHLMYYRTEAKKLGITFKLDPGTRFSSLPYIKGEEVFIHLIKRGMIDHKGAILVSLDTLENEIDQLSFSKQQNQEPHAYSKSYKQFLHQIIHIEKLVWNFLLARNLVAKNGWILGSLNQIHEGLTQFSIAVPSVKNRVTLPKERVSYYLEIFKKNMNYAIRKDELSVLRENYSIENKKIFLVNYEGLQPALKKNEELGKSLKKLSLIVNDESQRTKTEDSQIRKTLNELMAKNSEALKLNLTATPLELELSCILSNHLFLNPKEWLKDDLIQNIQKKYNKQRQKIFSEIESCITSSDEAFEKKGTAIELLTSNMRSLQELLIDLANNLGYRTIRHSSTHNQVVSINNDPRSCPPKQMDEGIIMWSPSQKQIEQINEIRSTNKDLDEELKKINSGTSKSKGFNLLSRAEKHPNFTYNNALFNAKERSDVVDRISNMITTHGVDEFISESGLLEAFVQTIEEVIKTKYSKDSNGRYFEDPKGKYAPHITVLIDSVPLTIAMNILIQSKIQSCTTYIYDGNTEDHQRSTILEDFNDPREFPKVLFLSKKTGGTGITLGYCTHVIATHSDYNPAIDHQAFGRGIRTGNSAKTVKTYLMECDKANYSTDQNRKIAQGYRKLLAKLFNDYDPKTADFEWIVELFFSRVELLYTEKKEAERVKNLKELILSTKFEDQLKVIPFAIESRGTKRELTDGIENPKELKKQKF